jgi:hypothetical protein
MLTRSLFEDVVVGHWLIFNDADPDWLVDRFFRHRDAMALHQERMANETQWAMSPPVAPTSAALRRRQGELVQEFGAEAQKDWWDPGKKGKGEGAPIGLRGIARKLEEAAAAHERFHPRFAGGDEPLLRRWERVAQKWFSQFMHHTAMGLPIILEPGEDDPPELARDPGAMVLFAGFWMFAQQIYLALELNDEDTTDFDEVFRGCWATLGFDDSQRPGPYPNPGWNQ